MPAASRQGGVGRPSLLTLACPRPEVLYRGWARMAPAGSQLAGRRADVGAAQ
jgi:hypothetical protein